MVTKFIISDLLSLQELDKPCSFWEYDVYKWCKIEVKDHCKKSPESLRWQKISLLLKRKLKQTKTMFLNVFDLLYTFIGLNCFLFGRIMFNIHSQNNWNFFFFKLWSYHYLFNKTAKVENKIRVPTTLQRSKIHTVTIEFTPWFLSNIALL